MGYKRRAAKCAQKLSKSGLPELAAISLRLRRDREAAFYGDIDLIPEQVFGRDSAQRALDDAERVVAATAHFTSS
jgi:hypothetical protein